MENAVEIRSRSEPESTAHRQDLLRSRASRTTKAARHHFSLEQQLAELRRENDDLRRALFEAAQVQRRLCGPRLLKRHSFEIASEIFPVRHLSGDFISLFEVQDDLVFAVGDIAGKGLPAGMWFTHVISNIRLQFTMYRDPSVVLASVNRGLLHAQLELPLTSVFIARLNPRTGELTYCNAGHPPAIVIRDNGYQEKLTQGGPLLGVLPETTFVDGKTILGRGDTLLAYSDGIPECRNAAGLEFGEERLLRDAQLLCASSSASMLFSILANVEDFAGGRPREDDIAVLVMQRNKQ